MLLEFNRINGSCQLFFRRDLKRRLIDLYTIDVIVASAGESYRRGKIGFGGHFSIRRIDKVDLIDAVRDIDRISGPCHREITKIMVGGRGVRVPGNDQIIDGPKAELVIVIGDRYVAAVLHQCYFIAGAVHVKHIDGMLDLYDVGGPGNV